jgi:hypothetical protein
MSEPARILTSDANVEFIVADAHTGEVRHKVVRHNTAGPGLVARLASRPVNGQHTTNSYDYYSTISWIGLSSNTTAAPTIVFGSPTAWWKDTYNSCFAWRRYSISDTYGHHVITTSSSVNAVPIWLKYSAKFSALYGNSDINTLLLGSFYGDAVGGDPPSSNSPGQPWTYYRQTCAFAVLSPGQRFTKTANDVVYVNWTININIPSARVQNEF